MSDVFFTEMDIPSPDENLNVGSGSHGRMTGEMLIRLESIMVDRKPDLVLVYGDTNSTLAGALAASKLHTPVAHVEAGLRSYMMVMPEEQNRRLTDHLSSYLFCPTETAIRNLAAEGIRNAKVSCPDADKKLVVNVGDLMYEASLHYRNVVKAGRSSRSFVADQFAKASSFALVTIHRAENTDDPTRLRGIFEALNKCDEHVFVFPVHPRTRKLINSYDIVLGKNVVMIDPVGYFDMIALESACRFVVTDSGGVQKEAFFFNKPCITLRDATEWVELVEHGWNALAGADTGSIVNAIHNIKKPEYAPLLYGDGQCARKIASIIAEGENA